MPRTWKPYRATQPTLGMKMLEIVSVIGIHGALIAVPMLEENLKALESP
ncbi:MULTISPECIES: hypothetical protein [Paraburkholderia]|nr:MULTISPECIES: hypothetical protein [Paraburkholderia]